MTQKTAILLINLGTPDAPTPASVRRYLREFLSDPRVVNLPRLPWQLLLNTVILPIRAPRVAKNYAKIWYENDSPLRVITTQIAEKLQHKLNIPVVVGMRYGQPKISDVLLQLQQQKIENLLILPLFPQYSSATTASIFDKVTAAIKTWRAIPTFNFINNYHDNPHYIAQLAQSVKAHWAEKGKAQKLIISFHGLPKQFIEKGDPYEKQCQATATLLAEALELAPQDWLLCYQSRFGKAAWLQPYVVDVLRQLPKDGIKSIEIISPGFPADCLETLEELAIQNRDIFMHAGGRSYEYIPALNASDAHIDCLAEIIKLKIGDINVHIF
jgi:ferrochelatase